MLTDVRWQKEQELMRSVFPQFSPFANPRDFGFEGRLKGPRSGRIYRVVLEADRKTYPQLPPGVVMDPHIGNHWIERSGRCSLCMIRGWQPARSTFANTVLAVLRFLEEFDGISACEPPLRRAARQRG